ncbi:bifunctional UDP-N-acetylmuramoyl-tripeptide:D-alanyl-D-alanine ligase/alanine racemase [Frigoriflavimonas asaccharolytica]|uniref:Alanine racemase n=1 Tax=Frigoriflavimonas asaccharolytica TaxID=2735899 RepID=A0A8J8K7P6_9FLAO|nr:bifunctional UDP-N-acetylmuramoyl-tripeptide:D-alanyl-D-alanine ligase/alanine racemase [Frigoriflavimonas asaccharolytica]NRS91172.1 alanine racemase [Frigoriflavimonas asaccharolytica]
MKYSCEEIAKITNSQIFGDSTLMISNIAYDTRKIFTHKETAFIALETEINSGRKYIQNAINKGIEIIISTEKIETPHPITWIIVENPLEFLQKLARIHLQNFDINTIGITGSNGKTIIKEWLFLCLNDDLSVVKSPKSFNSQLGLPLSLLEISKKHQVGIFEVGISKPNEMDIQESVFSPKIGVFTYLGSAHSANFENQNEILLEKLKLFKNSEIIIYNGDFNLVETEIKKSYADKKLFSFGLKKHNFVHLENDFNNKNEDVLISIGEEKIKIQVENRDEATISNMLCIVAVLKQLDYKNEEIIQKLSLLKPIEMRLESVVGENDNLIINDSFNLDLDSLYISYQFIKEYRKQKRCLVLTDFMEGKDSSENFYKYVANLTNQQNFDKIFLVGEEISQYQKFFNNESYTFLNTKQLIDSQQIKDINNSLILLKGARKFTLEKLKNILALQKHDTVLEVNLNAILHNINIHKSLLKPTTKMMAMVKAYTYGLGNYEIAEILQHHHIDYLGVAYADEGVELRKKGITTPIIVMNPEQSSYSSIIEYDLEPEIYSLRVLNLFHDKLIEKGIQKTYPIHFKIETGMHRLGIKDFEVADIIDNLKDMNVSVETIFSHLSSADSETEKEYTKFQANNFIEISSKLIEGLGYKPILHLLNSSGIANYPEYQFDMVRIGIGMIGISSNESIEKKLINAVEFKTVISQISEVKKGDSVGYNRNYIANENTLVATIPVGYADGIPRSIGNQVGYVGINKKLFPIVGNICMDMMMINIGDNNFIEGDEVILFNGNPTLKDFSKYCNTIPYEVLTSISQRVKRIYIKK